MKWDTFLTILVNYSTAQLFILLSSLNTPYLTLHTPHSSFLTPHLTLHTPHSHSSLPTPKITSSLHIQDPTLLIVCAVHTIHYTIHSTLNTSHFTLLTSHSTVSCRLILPHDPSIDCSTQPQGFLHWDCEGDWVENQGSSIDYWCGYWLLTTRFIEMKLC